MAIVDEVPNADVPSNADVLARIERVNAVPPFVDDPLKRFPLCGPTFMRWRPALIRLLHQHCKPDEGHVFQAAEPKDFTKAPSTTTVKADLVVMQDQMPERDRDRRRQRANHSSGIARKAP